MRRASLGLTLLASLVIFHGSASAGGWWSGIDLKGRYLGIGETVTARAEVWFRNLELAEKARSEAYHAYLVRGIDHERLERAMTRPEPKDWWSKPEEMTLVGDVRLGRWDGNIAVATARVRIPDIALGAHNLMFCDAGCTKPLGNVIPLRVQVTADALLAKTARKLQATNDRLDLALAHVRSDLGRIMTQARRAGTEATETRAELGRLRDKLSSLSKERPATPWLAYTGWFAAGAASVLAVVRRRKVVLAPETQSRPAEIPAPARELVRTP